MFVRSCLAIRRFLLVCHRVPGLGQAHAEEEDVALLEVDVALFGDGEDVVQGDDVLRESVDADAPFLGPGEVVD